MQQHIYFKDDDDDLTGQQDVGLVKSGHQRGGRKGGTRSGDGSVESTEEYSVVHADPAGDEVMESPRKQTGASQAAAANAGSAAAVEPSGKHKKLWKATPAAAASLSEAGPGIHGLHGGAAAADAAVHITLGAPAAAGAPAGTQEAAQHKKALRKSLKRKRRLQASMSPEGLAFGQASAQGAGAPSSAARIAEAAAVVTAKEAATLLALAGAGQTLAPPNAAATASVQRTEAKEARMTPGCELPAPQAVHAGAPGMTDLAARPAREGAEGAWRQEQCDRIAQELLVHLQSGLQGLAVEEVLAAAMVKALEQRHGRRYSSFQHDSLGNLATSEAAPPSAQQAPAQRSAVPLQGFPYAVLSPQKHVPALPHAPSLPITPGKTTSQFPQQPAEQAQGRVLPSEPSGARLPALPKAAGGADDAPLQRRRHVPVLPSGQLPAGHGPSAPAGRYSAVPASRQKAAGAGVGLRAQHRQGTTALGPQQPVKEAPQSVMHQQAGMLGAPQRHAPTAAQQGGRNVTPEKHTQGERAGNPPRQWLSLQAPSLPPAPSARPQQGQRLAQQAPILVLPAPRQEAGASAAFESSDRHALAKMIHLRQLQASAAPRRTLFQARRGYFTSREAPTSRAPCMREAVWVGLPDTLGRAAAPAEEPGQRTHQREACHAATASDTQNRTTRGGQNAEGSPREAAAADSETTYSEEAEWEEEAAAPCLSELAAGPRAHPRSATPRPAGKGPGQTAGTRLPKEKLLADLMSAAPERLGLNARREQRTEAVTGGPLAELASGAADEHTPAKATSPPGPGQGKGQRSQIREPSLPDRPRHARSSRPPQRLDPSAAGVPQWAARQAPHQQEAPPLSAAAAPLRGWQTAVQAAGSAAPGAQPVIGQPEGSQLPAKRGLASQAANAPLRKRASTGRQPAFMFVAPTREDLGYWHRPAEKRVQVPKFKEACVKRGIDEAAIKACHKCASQHLSHQCQSTKLECGPDKYKGNQHRHKLSFCFRCIEGTERCYGLWRYVKDAGDAEKLARFKQGWCVKCIGLCPCSKCKRLKLTDARDPP